MILFNVVYLPKFEARTQSPTGDTLRETDFWKKPPLTNVRFSNYESRYFRVKVCDWTPLLLRNISNLWNFERKVDACNAKNRLPEQLKMKQGGEAEIRNTMWVVSSDHGFSEMRVVEVKKKDFNPIRSWW